MTERKEPTLSPIRPEQDEIAARKRNQRSGAARPAAAGAQGNIPARPIVVKSKLAPLALLLALAGIGAAGFAYWQLEQTRLTLVSAEARIGELEKQLEMTGDESTASMTAVQAKLKWADSEIRKLWGVSFDRNKKAIESNQQEIAALKKGAGSVDGKIKAALKESTAEIKLINDLLDSQQTALTNVESKALAQVGQVQELTDKVRQLEKLDAELQRRITTNEEAIQAIDAFRRSINQQILELKATTP